MLFRHKAKISSSAKVLRDTKWSSVPAKTWFPEMYWQIKLGDIVPADVLIIDGGPAEVDQSALTGESLPVSHVIGEAVYSGSIMSAG